MRSSTTPETKHVQAVRMRSVRVMAVALACAWWSTGCRELMTPGTAALTLERNATWDGDWSYGVVIDVSQLHDGTRVEWDCILSGLTLSIERHENEGEARITGFADAGDIDVLAKALKGGAQSVPGFLVCPGYGGGVMPEIGSRHHVRIAGDSVVLRYSHPDYTVMQRGLLRGNTVEGELEIQLRNSQTLEPTAWKRGRFTLVKK